MDTYRDHVPGRKAVVFCVNVRHGEELADRFRAHDIPARSVSGRLSARERQECLENYAHGEIRVLCACDLLNEGWDCPDVEVLMMARPTLSKVIYLQQLGRGTRKAPDKECLIVFDFVDNASRYNSPLSLHRLVGQSRYKPGSLVLAPSNLLEQEKEVLTGGKTPTQVLPVELWTLDFQEIDVFNWQETVAGMVSTADLELELAAAEGRIRSAVERGIIRPDHTLSLGDRTYHYFRRERAEEIREGLGLPRIDDESIRGLFLEFVKKMDMSSSYKPVLLLALLDGIDERGRARLEDVVQSFQTFYRDRYRAGLPVERSGMRMLEVERLSKDEVRAVMLGMPFAKFERRKYMSYDKQDLSFLRFHPRLWQQLTAEDIATLRKCCEQAIADYYARFSS